MNIRVVFSWLAATAVAFVVVTLLNGCQSLHYQNASGNTASLTFKSENIAVQPVVCSDGHFRETAYSLSHKPFNSPGIDQLDTILKQSTAVHVLLPAGQVAHIGFIYTNHDAPGSRFMCKVAMVFKPDAGGQYQARFLLQGRHCSMKLEDNKGKAVQGAMPSGWKCH